MLFANNQKEIDYKMGTKKKSKSSLCNHLVELASLRIAQINDCKTCIAFHTEELKHLGGSDLKLSLVSVWNEVPYFSKIERALLTLTDNLATQDLDQPTVEVHNLLLLHFCEEEIHKLTFAIKQLDNWTLAMKSYAS